MVSTSMVYGCTIDVFNTEDISAECAGKKTYGGPYDVRSSVNWPLVEGGAWGDVQKTEFSAAKD